MKSDWEMTAMTSSEPARGHAPLPDHTCVSRVARARRVAMVAAAIVACAAGVAAGCRTSEYHISPEARTKLTAVLTTINTDIHASCTVGPLAQRYNSDVAKAKRQLRELQAVGTNAADRAVMLLAAQMLRYDQHRCVAIMLVDVEPNSAAEMEQRKESQKRACADELQPWLEGKANPYHLKAPCLKDAEALGPLLLQD